MSVSQNWFLVSRNLPAGGTARRVVETDWSDDTRRRIKQEVHQVQEEPARLDTQAYS